MGGRIRLRRQLLGMFVCGAVPLQPLPAQGTILVPAGGDKPPPVAQQPVADPDDSPEDIAKDAARDLKGSRFYNRPGATRADYDAAWQDCRLIARGSRTPSGMVPYYYNPAVVSPLAAGIGAGLGGLFANMIVQGEQRRANRRQCLLIRGWRLVEVPRAQAEKVALMTDEQRDAYFNAIVGADKVEGEITERSSFTQLSDPSLRLDAPVDGPGALFVGKKVDPAAKIDLAENEGLIALAFRRTIEGSAGRSGAVMLARYDLAGRDLIYQPRDWKKTGDKTTYRVNVASADKKAVYEVQLVKVTASDYVLDSLMTGPGISLMSNCFGAPTIHVGAGEVVYGGDFVPVINARLPDGRKVLGTFWTRNMDDARKTIATRQPDLAGRMIEAGWRNQASYACAAQIMERFDLPGVAALESPPPAAPQSAGVDTPPEDPAPPAASVPETTTNS